MDYNLSCVKVGNLDTNCYILKRDGLHGAVVIDPGDDPFIIKSTLLEMDATPDLILLTHGHFDHILAVNPVSGWIRWKIPPPAPTAVPRI